MSLKTASLRDALTPQDGLYTLVELDETPTVRVIGAIRELLVAAEDAAAVSRRLCAPDTSLITITVTEKGYCLDGTGVLDFEHPDILHDLRHPETPRSLVGWLVRGLHLRHQRGLGPCLVLSCDNLSDNGPTLQRAVLAFAARRNAALAAWIEKGTRFPRTMVDSITPATDAALLSRVTHAHQDFRTRGPSNANDSCNGSWRMTDFAKQPDWASVGVTLSRDVSVYERAKLRLLNGAHSTLAYLGLLAGLETVAQAMAQPALRAFVERLMIEDIEPTLTGEDLVAYRRSILRRFENPAMQHHLAQIAWDGSQKLPIRLLGTMADAIRAHRPLTRLALPIAAWLLFFRARAAAQHADRRPTRQERLAACGRRTTGETRNTTYRCFLTCPECFPDRSHP